VLHDELELAIDELPDDQRDVFVAHELEGRSFKEMAASTGVSVNTLLSHKRLCGAASAGATSRPLRWQPSIAAQKSKSPSLDFSKRGFALGGVQSGMKLGGRIEGKSVGAEHAFD
jgi:hypothetical protein